VGHFNQPPGQYTAWVGVRFRRDDDDDDDAGDEQGGDGCDAGTGGLFDSSPNGFDKGKGDAVQAVQGLSGVPYKEPYMSETGRPLHRLHTAPKTGSDEDDTAGSGVSRDSDLGEWLSQQEGRCPECRWHIEQQGHRADCLRLPTTS
jgi:hypothetical protein